MSDLDIVRAVEEMNLNAVPALETCFLRGWVIRTAAGVTGRANSAAALAGEPAPVAEIMPHILARYRIAGITPRVRVSPLAPEGTSAWLAAEGWTPEVPVLTEVADLPLGEIDPAVELNGTSDAAWRLAYARNAGRFGPAELDILGRMHRAIPVPVVFARLVEDGEIAAIGFAVAERGWVGLHEIGTAPGARRGGRAGRILSTLFAWGREQGARRAWLQVASDNAPAIPLYRRLGFETAYTYDYWRL